MGSSLRSIGESEAFADPVVGYRQNIRAAQLEDEQHVNGPWTDASDPMVSWGKDKRFIHPGNGAGRWNRCPKPFFAAMSLMDATLVARQTDAA